MIPSALGRLGGVRTVNITSNQTNYNLRTALGSPAGAMRIVVKIASGVTISSSSAGVPAFDEGAGWASGTTISIVNEGSIYGAGGGGGGGGNSLWNGTPVTHSGQSGVAGGTALKLTVPTSIANAAGSIFGGGGGGGGSAGSWMSFRGGAGDLDVYSSGGGGGGGRGSSTSSGGSAGIESHRASELGVAGAAGSSGSSAGGGSGGAGGYLSFTAPDGYPSILDGGNGGVGGNWGTAGSSAGAATQSSASPDLVPLTQSSVGSGGVAGKAVDLNGQTLTWISGNDPSRVKGAVS